MKYLITILIIILGLTLVGNYPVLSRKYPTHKKDHYVFLKYYNDKNIVNSAMHFTSFLTLFLMAKSYPLARAIAKFFMFISFGSFFDTASGINHYLRSDILLSIIAFEVSIFQYYFYDRKTRRGA